MIQWDLFGTWILHVQASCGDYCMQYDCKFCVLYAGCPNNNVCMRPSMILVLTVHIPGILEYLLPDCPCLSHNDSFIVHVLIFHKYWKNCA